MKVVFLAKIYGLDLAWDCGDGIHLTPSLKISNNIRVATRLLQPIEEAIGALEVRDLADHPVYAYAEHRGMGEVNPLTVVNNYLMLLQTFFTALWLVKDNSVNTETGFAYQESPLGVFVSANSRRVHFTSCLNRTESIVLTETEFSSARTLVDRFTFEGHPVTLETWEPFKERPGAIPPDRKSNRVERAWHELQSLRSTSFINARIAGYCTILETFLSTDGSEISHKIAERTARLLGKDLDSRLTIYQTVKKAYNVRSKYVHGSTSPKHVDVETVSQDLDTIVRGIMRKVFDEPEVRDQILGSDEQLEKWLLQISLS